MKHATPTQAAGLNVATVATLQLVALNDHEALAQEIRQDLAEHERTSRQAAFLALRVGVRLVWLRDNAERGLLLHFMEAHFPQSRRTLYNYIRIADAFIRDAGLCDRKTHKLTDGNAVAPILQEQLELFTDPQAKLEGAVKKLVKWVGDRGLTDIYRQLEARHEAPGSGGKTGKPAMPAGDIIADMSAKRSLAQHATSDLRAFFEGRAWQDLDREEQGALLALLEKFTTHLKKELRR